MSRGSEKPGCVGSCPLRLQREQGRLSKRGPTALWQSRAGEPHHCHKHTVVNHLSSSVYFCTYTWPLGSTNVYSTSVLYRTIAEAKGNERKCSFTAFQIPKPCSAMSLEAALQKSNAGPVYHTAAWPEPEGWALKITEPRNSTWDPNPGISFFSSHFNHTTLLLDAAIWHWLQGVFWPRVHAMRDTSSLVYNSLLMSQRQGILRLLNSFCYHLFEMGSNVAQANLKRAM